MPRRGRGGARQGQPGKAYSNRSDMQAQPVRTPPSARYGDGAAQARAQEAVPLPQAAGPAVGVVPSSPSGPLPGELPIGRPSERPTEPLTAGMPMGMGPGPSAVMPAVDPVVESLRRAAQAFPNQAIFDLLEAVDGQ